MVSSKEESFSEKTKSANSEYGANWQQDSDEEDLMSSERSSRSTHKRRWTSSLPTTHKMNILAPAYPDVPVVNSSLYQNPWPWMCPPWIQNPWMYAQQMLMSPPWTTMGPQPAVMSYYAPWMQVPPTPWDHLKDYRGNGPELKKAEKRVKASRHVKNVSNVGRKAKVRKVVKLKKKKKRGNHLNLTEKLERLQASLQALQGNWQKKSSNWLEEMEGKLSEALANAIAIKEAVHELKSKLDVEYVVDSSHGSCP